MVLIQSCSQIKKFAFAEEEYYHFLRRGSPITSAESPIITRTIRLNGVANPHSQPGFPVSHSPPDVSPPRLLQVHEWEIGNNKLKSKMEIDPATPMDVGYYECQANNKHAVDHRGFRTQYTAGL